MAKAMNAEELRRLARLGAAARIDELQRELAALRAAFPGLGATRGRKPGRPAAAAAAEAGGRRRRGMSAAQRREVSRRMKKYWAERRKQKAKQ